VTAWRVELTPVAVEQLAAIGDVRIRRQIAWRIDEMASEPDKKGKPLVGQLQGFYSMRAAGQRYRILYRLQHKMVVVYVVALGLRKEVDRRDVYALARRLLRLGLLQTEDTAEGAQE
jgi:mRNA interferase RelE/StbE